MGSRNKAKAQQRQAHYSSHIEVYNVDNSTGSPSVLLFFDKQRYLFNAGEGIQRHFIEYKKKMQKMNTVLVTRVSTDTLAGLPGMLLSQVTPGPDGFKGDNVAATVHGPVGLSKYCHAFKDYASNFQLKVVESDATNSSSPIIQEPFVSIKAVALEPITSNTVRNTDSGSTEPAAKKQRTDDSSAKDTLQELYDRTARAANGTTSQLQSASCLGRSMSAAAPLVTCYICQLASIPGKLDPQKAAQLGVPRGPLLGELQRGKPVTASNGQLVHPHQVVETPDMPGACLLVIDCPSMAYLPALEGSPQLQEVQQQAQKLTATENTSVVVAEGSADPAGSQTAAGDVVQKRFVMLHIGPTDVTSSSSYRTWLEGFGPQVEHLMVSSDSQYRPTVRRAATLQAQLNVIEPQVYSDQGFMSLTQQQQGPEQQGNGLQIPEHKGPLQGDVQQQEQGTPAADGSKGQPGQQLTNTQQVLNGVQYTLAPQRYQGLDTANVTAAVDAQAVQADINSSRPAVLQLLEEYRTAKAAVQQEGVPPQLAGINRTSCELTLLGTCSACPSNHRNVSAYYLDLFDKGGLLMDCGEDTMGQMERRYGREDAARRIMQLHVVWISHMHADHHGGLYPLLLHRQFLRQQSASSSATENSNGMQQHRPLLILGPWPLFRVLCDYSKVLQIQFKFIPNTYFYTPDPRSPPVDCMELYEAVKAAAGLKVLQPFPVQHVAHSTGLQLESQDGWKVVFSGDTRPCKSVVSAAKGATLLVHEATFEDELQDEAIAKKHSTTAEALGIAAAAGVYRTVLTHFSSRYPKIPVMKPQAVAKVAAGAQEGSAGSSNTEGTTADDSAQTDQAAAEGSDLAAVGSVIVGFDLMSINLADLPWLPKMLPVLDELFKEEEQAYKKEEEAD